MPTARLISTTLTVARPSLRCLKSSVAKDLADKAPSKGDTIKTVYFGNKDQKKIFMVTGIAGKRIDWTTPLPLTEKSVEYIKSLDTLPEKGAERLAFFLDYLEHEDPLLAQDAYDEFGRAPYDEVIAVGDQIDRPQLLGWIEDAQVGPTRRRLYLTMLGICGKDEDIAFLESLLRYDYKQMKPGLAAMQVLMRQAGPAFGSSVLNEMIKADVRRKQQCLDALVAAYLKLKGPEGLPLIEERFLANPAAEYTHVYAAVMALRFHGEETDSLPRERLLQSVRKVLGQPRHCRSGDSRPCSLGRLERDGSARHDVQRVRRKRLGPPAGGFVPACCDRPTARD